MKTLRKISFVLSIHVVHGYYGVTKYYVFFWQITRTISLPITSAKESAREATIEALAQGRGRARGCGGVENMPVVQHLREIMTKVSYPSLPLSLDSTRLLRRARIL